MTKQSTEDFYGSKNTLHDHMMHIWVHICPQSVQHQERTLSYGLWMTTCQCRFITCNKYTVVGGVDNRRGMHV